MAQRVAVGGIDEVTAALQEPGDDALRLRHARTPAPFLSKGHRPEAERTYPQPRIPQRPVMIERHLCGSPPCRSKDQTTNRIRPAIGNKGPFDPRSNPARLPKLLRGDGFRSSAILDTARGLVTLRVRLPILDDSVRRLVD